MPTQDELILALRQIGADDVADGLESVAKDLDRLEDSQDKVNKTGDEAAKTTQKQARGLADLKAGLDMAGKALGTVKDFLVDAVKETVAYAETTRDLARSIGATAEEASTLIQVADDVKVSTGTLEAAFKAAIKNGIRPSIDNLAKLSDQYIAIQDPVARSQFAMDKFGRAGLEMGKLLEMGSDAIRESAKEAKNLGLVLDDKAVKAAREFEINLDNLGDKFEAFKIGIGNKAIPALNSFIDTMERGLDVGNALFYGISDIGDAYENKLTSAIAYAVAAFGAESDEVKELSSQLRDYLILRNQVAMTEQEHALRASMAQVRTLELTRSAGDETVGYILAEEAAMKQAAQAADAQAAAMKRNADAQAAAAKVAADAAIAYNGTAQSLVNAQELGDYAKVALGGLDQQLKTGQITASQYNAAFAILGVNAGLVSKESLAATRGLDAINKAFADGLINADQYSQAVAKVPTAAKDGVVTLEEVGIKTTGQIKKSKQDLLDETDGAIKQVVSKTSESVSNSMLSVSNATSAAKGLVKSLKDEILSLPDYRKITLEIDVRGELPMRANGGPISAGMPYLVGERGPEVVVPSNNGTVIPNTNNYNTTYNITTDRMGVALAMARAQQMTAEARM